MFNAAVFRSKQSVFNTLLWQAVSTGSAFPCNKPLFLLYFNILHTITVSWQDTVIVTSLLHFQLNQQKVHILGFMRSIFEYMDYRKFLADYYAFKKNANRNFSYRVFNAKAGISSPVFFKLVIDGKRNLGLSSIDKFATALNLNKKETVYFKKLVLFDQSDNPEEKQEHYAVIRSMRNLISEKALTNVQYEYFSNWYNVVIREIVTLYNFHDDYQLLAEAVKPPITAAEAKASVELLLKLNLLKKNEQGFYEQVDTAISADSDLGLIAVRHFNRSMLLKAIKAIDEIDRRERHISGLTIGISKSLFAVLDVEIAAFKERIVSLVNREENSSGVYQLNIQLFPVSNHTDEIRTKGRNTK